MNDLKAVAHQELEAGTALCLVRVESVSGSAPRDAGTLMLISESDFWGTIGGGQLEWLTLKEARVLLLSDSDEMMLDVPLGPEINQCCGGRVGLSFMRLKPGSLSAAFPQQPVPLPPVQIHGAGHTGHALCQALALLPFDVTMVDTRENALADLPPPVARCHTALPESMVREAKPGTAFVVLTHSHDLDFLITAEALTRGDATYVGMIGSATKRAVFTKWLGRKGYDPSLAGGLICPIGSNTVKDKRPEVIAAMVAAELLTVFAEAKNQTLSTGHSQPA